MKDAGAKGFPKFAAFVNMVSYYAYAMRLVRVERNSEDFVAECKADEALLLPRPYVRLAGRAASGEKHCSSMLVDDEDIIVPGFASGCIYWAVVIGKDRQADIDKKLGLFLVDQTDVRVVRSKKGPKLDILVARYTTKGVGQTEGMPIKDA